MYCTIFYIICFIQIINMKFRKLAVIMLRMICSISVLTLLPFSTSFLDEPELEPSMLTYKDGKLITGDDKSDGSDQSEDEEGSGDEDGEEDEDGSGEEEGMGGLFMSDWLINGWIC